MTTTSKIIMTSGEERPLKDLSLETMQAAVGGYIEFVAVPRCARRSQRGGALIVNEDGRAKQLGFNARASMIARQTLLGDVILISPEDNQKMQEEDKC